jgi:TetR/AcrR family transcriptional repressor of nem operon
LRITNERKQANHDRIVATASEMFRDRGFDGASVAELMEKSGLTHGGFYNHFRSKDDLMAEAAAEGFASIAERYAGCDAATAVELYVSREHRDGRAQGCPAAALSGEAARQPDEIKSVFAAGIENLMHALEKDMARAGVPEMQVRPRAISALAEAVGAIVLSRACPDTLPLADEILDICRADCRAKVAPDDDRRANERTFDEV